MAPEQERDAAIDAVRRASRACRRTQAALADGDTEVKADASPVTIADLAAQAIVWRTLTDTVGDIEMVGEEDPGSMSANPDLADRVARTVAGEIDGADVAAVIDWIGAGSAEGTGDSFWTLDPIDGTKGFLRGDQYAIALAKIVGGEVVLGVLGCPNLPNPDGSRGALVVADRSGCEAWYGDAADPVAFHVTSSGALADAKFCESVESGHSSHGDAAEVARRLGITAEPYRIDSQCKYAAVARGDASIYLRLPTRADYREKIWDHAAGKFVVERAGGRVTDATGADLTFGLGRRLERNVGVIATDGRFHDEVVGAVVEVLGL